MGDSLSEVVLQDAIEKSQEIDNRLNDMLEATKILEDVITVSKKRYGKLYKERDRLRRSWYATIGIAAVILALCIVLLVIIGTLSKAKIVDSLNEVSIDVGARVEHIEELENEVKQLRDRIAFLSLKYADYERDEGLGEDEEEIELPKEIKWTDYVQLFSIGQKVPLPDIDTNTFRCMDFRTITDTTSWQYKIQQVSYTDNYSGLRIFSYGGEKYYTVALATAYGIDIGNAYRVELENGTVFNIIHAEYKHDIRYPSPTDFGDADKNYDGKDTISVIEFIYDWVAAPQRLIDDGEANRFLGEGCDIYGTGCNIKSMTYLGKIWSVV